MSNLLMHDPDLLWVLINEFFEIRLQENRVPTVPGFVLSIGFNRTGDLTKVLTDWETGDSKYPNRSVEYLLRAITKIEDETLLRGLESKIPPMLAKFALGSYHSVKEPEKAASDTITALQIVFEAEPDHRKEFKSITSSRPNQNKPHQLIDGHIKVNL